MTRVIDNEVPEPVAALREASEGLVWALYQTTSAYIDSQDRKAVYQQAKEAGQRHVDVAVHQADGQLVERKIPLAQYERDVVVPSEAKVEVLLVALRAAIEQRVVAEDPALEDKPNLLSYQVEQQFKQQLAAMEIGIDAGKELAR